MSAVITLTLSWNKLEGGWQIEICGGNRSIDMSAYNFVPKETGPFRTEYVGFFFPDARSVGTGPKVWLLTPAQEPILGHRNGARQENPPLAKVTQFLQTLENKGCKIVTSHSSSFEDGAPPVSVWTLEQDFREPMLTYLTLFGAWMLLVAFGSKESKAR